MAEGRFLLERFMTLLLPNLPSGLFPLNVAKFSLSSGTLTTLVYGEFSALLLVLFFALFCILFTNFVKLFRGAWKNSWDSFLELFHSFRVRKVCILSKSCYRDPQKGYKNYFKFKMTKLFHKASQNKLFNFSIFWKITYFFAFCYFLSSLSRWFLTLNNHFKSKLQSFISSQKSVHQKTVSYKVPLKVSRSIHCPSLLHCCAILPWIVQRGTHCKNFSLIPSPSITAQTIYRFLETQCGKTIYILILIS